MNRYALGIHLYRKLYMQISLSLHLAVAVKLADFKTKFDQVLRVVFGNGACCYCGIGQPREFPVRGLPPGSNPAEGDSVLMDIS